MPESEHASKTCGELAKPIPLLLLIHSNKTGLAQQRLHACCSYSSVVLDAGHCRAAKPLNQETKEGLAALLSSPPHPRSRRCAEPGPVVSPDRLGLNIDLIECCLQPHFLFRKYLLQLALGHFKYHL